MDTNDGTWRDHRDELFDRVVRRGQARKRRRGLAVSVALLVVVLAVTAGLFLPDRGRDTLRVAPPDNESTTTVAPRPENVLLIGDTVMLGARSALEDTIPNAFVDAKVTRQFWDAIPVLEAFKRDVGLPPTIVIHLGTNGKFAQEQFQQLMDTVGAESQVYFLTVKLRRPWEGEVNDSLYSDVASFANAHVLAWHDFSSSHDDWFVKDGFHLSPAGQVAYAGFIRDGVRPPVTTFSDPFADRAVPASGFVLTDNAKQGAEREPSTFDIKLLDASGQELASLPRAAIENDVLNAPQHVLVLTDSGIHLEPASFAAAADMPSSCTPAERSEELAVAVCGPGSGINVLGDRIVVDNGTGWRQVIGRPPAPPGVTTVGGHWAWASASPDGRWVAAQWSGEREVPVGFLVSTADGSLRTVTGEAGAGWGDAPNSGVIGWAADGSAMGLFAGESGCGTSSPAQRGVYLVSPDTGTRRLLLALTPSQSVLTWNSIDDQRAGTDSFIGHWNVHGAQLEIESNTAGVETSNCGGQVCVETDKLSLSLSPDRNRMNAQITEITYTDENGVPIPDPFSGQSQRVGDSFYLEFAAPHLLKATIVHSSVPAADREGNNSYWCGEGLASSLVHLCGA